LVLATFVLRNARFPVFTESLVNAPLLVQCNVDDHAIVPPLAQRYLRDLFERI
jgi:hypothetical protein